MFKDLIGKKLTYEDLKIFPKWIVEWKTIDEMQEITNLPIFKEHPELLTPSVFF